MINCYLLKVIWAVFCWALLHLDRWNYIHLPSPLAIGKINEMLVSLPPTFSWGKCWQPRINVAIDLPVISKGTRQVLPLLGGEMGRQQPLATLWVWLTGLCCLDWLGRLRQRGWRLAKTSIHLGSTAWRLAHPSLEVPKPRTLSGSTTLTSCRPLQICYFIHTMRLEIPAMMTGGIWRDVLCKY